MGEGLSKTAALRESGRYISVYGRHVSWTITGPMAEPGGLLVEMRATSYAQARAYAAHWRAELALELMGVDKRAAWDALDRLRAMCAPANTRYLVNAVLERLSR